MKQSIYKLRVVLAVPCRQQRHMAEADFPSNHVIEGFCNHITLIFDLLMSLPMGEVNFE